MEASHQSRAPPAASCILSSAWSIVKLAAFWRGGKVRNVERKSTTMACAARIRYAFDRYQSQYVFDVVSARSNGSVRREVEELRHAQRHERLRPQLQGSARPLLHEDELPVVEPQRDEIAVVREVDEALARADVLLSDQVQEQVEAVDVHLEGLAGGLVADLRLLDDVRLAGRREERWQPVVVLDDLVGDDAGGDLSRPPHEQRDAGAFSSSCSSRSGTASSPPSGHVFMCGPLSVAYITIVSSVIPRRSSRSRIWPTWRSWSSIVSW